MSYLRVLFLGLIFLLPLSLSAADAIDINTADAQAIATAMKGVGLVKAQAIIDYRQKNGAFSSIDDLVNVKGIGVKTIALNKDAIRVQPVVANQPAAPQKP